MKSVERRTFLHGIAGGSIFLATGCGGGDSGSGTPPNATPGSSLPPLNPPAAVPQRPQYVAQVSSLPASPYDVGVDIDWHVDAVRGSDSGTGEVASPFRTIDRARDVAAERDVIGLHRGQTHFRTAQTTPRRNVTQSVVGYGDSVEPATVSAGQSLSGALWSLHGAGIYRTRILLPDAHLPGGSGLGGSNTTYPFVREGETYLDWIVGETTIEANLARLGQLQRGGFVIGASGSLTPDIRDEAARATVFDLFVRLENGIDPSGRDLITLAHSQAYKYGSELLQDLRIRDAWGKDTTGTAERQDTIPRLRRIEILGAGGHGWVGTAHVDGFRAVGFARPGMHEENKGRASGAGLNFFSPEDRDTQISVAGLDIENFASAIYGHTSSQSSQFARRIDVSAARHEGFADFRVRNCAAAIKIDPKNGRAVLPDGLSVECAVDIVDVDIVLATESEASLNGGGVAIFADPVGTYQFQIMAQLRSGVAKHTFRDMTFYTPNTFSEDLVLEIARGGSTADGTPEVTFINCDLPLHPAYAFRIGTRFANSREFYLAQLGSTEMGDFAPYLGSPLPLRFRATGSGAFALQDIKTLQRVREFLDREGIPNEVSDSVTLLRTDGSRA